MPFAVIFTSLPREKIPDDFITKFMSVTAEVTRVPEDWITVTVQPGMWTVTGTDTEAQSLRALVYSSNFKPSDENAEKCKKLSDCILDNLDIKPNGVVVMLQNIDKTMLSIGGTLGSMFKM